LFINWSKYATILKNLSVNQNSSTKNPAEIDHTIDTFTSIVHTAVQSSSSTKKLSRSIKYLPYIDNEIRHENHLRREWQRSRDPAIERCLNAKISLQGRWAGQSKAGGTNFLTTLTTKTAQFTMSTNASCTNLQPFY